MPKAELGTGFLQELMGSAMAVWLQDPSLMNAASSSCAQGTVCAWGQAGENFRFQRASVRQEFQFALQRDVPNLGGWVKVVI